jgi:DMSO/TMAO reductase YedYZ heme-binding membrane subunit
VGNGNRGERRVHTRNSRILGLLVLFDKIALGVTSRDAADIKMGGRNWKKLHRTIYMVLGLVLLHALFVGADFGLRRSPDVRGR